MESDDLNPASLPPGTRIGPWRLLEQRGRTVTVAYDVDRPGSARRAATAVGGSPFLHPLVLLFGGLGLLLLAAAAINLAVETWWP